MVDAYLAHRKRNDRLDPKSLRLERTISVHYLTWCGEVNFSKAPSLDPGFVEYVEQQDYSENYKAKLVSSAKRFFEWLVAENKGFRGITLVWLRTFRYKIVRDEFDDKLTVAEEEAFQIARLPAKTLIEKRIRAGACFLYLSGMRVSAFTSMPIKAVDLEKLEIRQSPSLGMLTKNRKSATTYLLELEEIMRVVREWDAFVRTLLSGEEYWFAPLSPITGEIDSTPRKANENRSTLFRKNLRAWLEKNHVTAHSPHNFRRGHTNFLFDRAKDIADIDAARENLMHESLTTTEMYARKRRNQIKSRIQNMVTNTKRAETQSDLAAIISRLENIEKLVKERPS